ncbi:methyltransferase domain-containing protein [Streptomyces sp. 3MP-14]|uniref:Methyltransferase domain-containing protein n=1 Tax=Streptomyces mimosae TaxID=2586635 RepID=A0A5N5ZWW0_9ACTN|nr:MULTISPECIES: class I SAM-dependent methyltransferase [Streptomyces]KAB8160293.1 methyltransferase domain-containing protein [Streptomyces mimosae]KAB8172945.1 methyltransferase domain-containing protein [Streptomyces sp. 3MP-14]
MTALDSSIAAYWDAAAADFDAEPDHGLLAPRTREAWARRLAEWIPPATAPSAPPSEVLDVGCGTGSLSLLLAEAGHRVTGVDLAPRMVAAARAKFAAAGREGRFLVGDAAQPPVGERRFDALIVRHLVWTLPDPAAALREWVGRLRPGGRLVLVEGRWREAGQSGTPYVPGAEALPWHHGVAADELAPVVRPLVGALRVEDLAGDEALWGGPVTDERYALIAELA